MASTKCVGKVSAKPMASKSMERKQAVMMKAKVAKNK